MEARGIDVRGVHQHAARVATHPRCTQERDEGIQHEIRLSTARRSERSAMGWQEAYNRQSHASSSSAAPQPAAPNATNSTRTRLRTQSAEVRAVDGPPQLGGAVARGSDEVPPVVRPAPTAASNRTQRQNDQAIAGAENQRPQTSHTRAIPTRKARLGGDRTGYWKQSIKSNSLHIVDEVVVARERVQQAAALHAQRQRQRQSIDV